MLFQERDVEKRQEFLRRLAKVAPCDRVYVDEAGVEDTLTWPYGWSPKGTRCPGERLGHCTQRVSMAAGLSCGEVIAPLTFEGYCDSDLIEAWFSQQLAPALRPGQVVILDNASFHRMARLSEILAEHGCGVLPLPPYSPDLNDIEPLWNTLKRRIELDQTHYPSFRLKVDAAFL